jgi:hypothetical protein
MHHKYEQQNGCNTVFARDIVCLRNISINTLHKGDDYYYNNNNKKKKNTHQVLFKYVLDTWIKSETPKHNFIDSRKEI